MPIITSLKRLTARLMRIAGLVLALLALAFAGAAAAQEEADLVIVDANGQLVKSYTVDDLAALPQHRIVTGNEFVEGKVTFEGPRVRDVLKDAGITPARKMTFIALNDYAVQIPSAEFAKYDPILALKANGKWLSRRDKGPIWMIYPMDDFPELHDPVFNSRLIWQLARIENR